MVPQRAHSRDSHAPFVSSTEVSQAAGFWCESILELTFVVESNKYRWAHLLKALLQEACHKVNRSHRPRS